MFERTEPAVSSFWPRSTGALWLGCIVASIVSVVISSKLVKIDDAAATAANILQHESLFRLGFVADLASTAFYVGVTALLFYLLRPVSRSGSLLAACFGICGLAIGGVALVSHLASIGLLQGGPALGGLSTSQQQTAALIALRLQLQVFSIGMVFFGVQCVIAGYLITRSGYLPRALGILLALGGTSYLISCFVSFMSPDFGARLAPFILPMGLLGEGSLTFWLLFKGSGLKYPLRAEALAA
jgi:hypothetical protein